MQCYYLMSFDQNMIIDATSGSIARFVNHSCSPNCRMIKWIVSGQPRMALFAGDRPIMTGDELTYDYNFDPFSAKNVQKCLCGSANCRGVLGPKPKEVKPPKPAKEEKKPAKATKRKVKDAFEFDGDDEDDTKAIKRRKIKAATGAKRALSSASLKAAKGAVKGAAKGAVATIKRTVSVTAKKSAVTSSKGKITKAKMAATLRKVATSRVIKASVKRKNTASSRKKKTTKIVVKPSTSRSPSLTIVAAGVSAEKSPRSSSGGSAERMPKLTMSSSTGAKKTSPRKVTPSRKVLENGGVLYKPQPASAKPAAKSGGGGLEVPRPPTKIRLVSSVSQ